MDWRPRQDKRTILTTSWRMKESETFIGELYPIWYQTSWWVTMMMMTTLKNSEKRKGQITLEERFRNESRSIVLRCVTGNR